MKIGIDARSLEGERTGVGRYCYELLKQWVSSAPKEVSFILYFKKNIPDDISKMPKDRITTKILPFVLRPSNAFFMHVALPWATVRDDVAHLFCPEYIAPIMCPVPYSITLHDIVYAARPELYFWPGILDRVFLPFLSQHAARGAKNVFVPSKFSKKEVMRVFSIKEDRITVTPEAAGSEFTPEGSVELPGNVAVHGPYFIFWGSIFSRRHVAECMLAFAKLAEMHQDLQFLVIGRDRTRPPGHIDALAQKINTDLQREAIVRLPFLESSALPAVLRGALGAIWVSEYEGFGLPALEALACGTPLISSHNTSLPEVAGDAALYTESISSKDALYSSMRRLYEDTNLRTELSKKGIKQAINFSWKACAEETLKRIMIL